MLLVLIGAVSDLAEAVEEDRTGEAVARLTFVEFLAGGAPQFRALDPVQGEEGALQPAQFAQSRGDAILPGVGGELTHDHGGGDGAGADGGGDAQDVGPVGADQGDVEAPGDECLEGRVVGRPAEAVEAPVLQVGDAGREPEAQQGAEREDVLGFPAAVGVMAMRLGLTLVMQQSVQHVECLRRRGRDQPAGEGRISVGQVAVDLEPWLLTVVGVVAAGVVAESTGPEELAVGGRGGAAAEHRREGFALLVVD